MNILKEWAKKARVGGQITINGAQYPIEEIIAYHHGAEKWVNIVTHTESGQEIAVEAVEDETELTLWRRQTPKTYELAIAALLRESNYTLVEEGLARAIVETTEGTEATNSSYWVFRSESGRRIAVEMWDGQYYFYIADETAPVAFF